MRTEIKLLLHYAKPIITPRCDVFFMGDGRGENKSAITIKLVEELIDGKNIARLRARYIHEANINALRAQAQAANDECLLAGRATARATHRKGRGRGAGGPAARSSDDEPCS